MWFRNMGNAAVRIMWNQRRVWQERHAKRVGHFIHSLYDGMPILYDLYEFEIV